MRFEPRHRFQAASVYGRFWPHTSLPPQLAFLEGLSPDVAARIMALAARHATCPVRELVANGVWSERHYYEALAHHLGVPFVADWPPVDAAEPDPVRCSEQGRVRLADGTWLVAPQGPDLAELCAAGIAPATTAITTPSHLVALVHRAAQTTFARWASDRLPQTAPALSARRLASRRTAFVALGTALAGLAAAWLERRIVCDVVGAVFFASMSLRLLVTANGCPRPVADPALLHDADLPDYSVLVPVRREAAMLPHLLAALSALDYPRAKLQVLILIEPEDREMRDALARSNLPPWVQVVFGPTGGTLRTKPRALNLGLAAARGTLVTVFDAEDRPAPDQLKRAATRFAADPTIACLQARLVMLAGDRGVLDRLFAIEYAALFDVFNLGLARAGLPMPLGGTSNHFRADALRAVGGWDAWNVTEDADLGLRLARFGHRVDILDSVTYETPPDTPRIWLRQRRRWMKGWMQTALVLVADARRTCVDLRAGRTLVVALLLAGLTLGPLALPLCMLWLVVEIARSGLPTPRSPIELAEATLAASVFLMGAISPLWCGFAGLRASRRYGLLTALPWLLPYQLLIGLAAWAGLHDLVVRPFHWHKTPHRPR